jgi:competence protein ComEC
VTHFYALYRPIHASYLIATGAISTVLGIVSCMIFSAFFTDISWLILAIILLSVSFYKRQKWVIILVIIAGGLIGAWRGGYAVIERQKFEVLYGQTVSLYGIVSEDVVEGKYGEKRIVLTNIQIKNRSYSGSIWVAAYTKQHIKRSDAISIQGKIKNGFGGYAASIANAQVTTFQHRGDTARDVRDTFSQRVRNSIPEPEASLGIGFLVGQRSSLPEEFDTALRVAGLTHIVVASGYNLTVLLRAAKRLFSRISKYLTALVGGSLVVGFIFITGLSPSMSRAGLVAGLSLAAWYYGRKFNPFILLPIVAALTIMWNPSYVWGDIGWYLSFAAFTGVMIVSPLLHHYFFGPKKPGFFRQILFETTAALIMTIPITVLIFQQYATYALIANILIVPIISVVMLLVFIAGILPASAPLAYIPLHYITTITQWINQLPNASGEAHVSVWFGVVWYVLVFGFSWYMWRKTAHDFCDDNLIE